MTPGPETARDQGAAQAPKLRDPRWQVETLLRGNTRVDAAEVRRSLAVNASDLVLSRQAAAVLSDQTAGSDATRGASLRA